MSDGPECFVPIGDWPKLPCARGTLGCCVVHDVRARLDPGANAEPKTRLLARVDVTKAGSHSITPGPATVLEDTATGERVALHAPTPDRRDARIAELEAELREARVEREGLRTAWHAEIRASAVIDKAAADAMAGTVREMGDIRAQLSARDALLGECAEMLGRCAEALHFADDGSEESDMGLFEIGLNEAQREGLGSEPSIYVAYADDIRDCMSGAEVDARDLARRVREAK